MGSIFKAPAHLPSFSMLLQSLGDPSAQDVARFLGVSLRSFYGWKRADVAPRPIMLALFYESEWGRSLVDAEATNAARVARGLVGSLERENANLRARLARLESLAQFGSANAPTLSPALGNCLSDHVPAAPCPAPSWRAHAGALGPT